MTKVSAAEAGPIRLRSAQERPTRLLKKAMAMKKMPAKSAPLESTRAITANEAMIAAELAEVADAAHGQRDENVSSGGGADRGEDADPGVKVPHTLFLHRAGIGDLGGWMLGAGRAAGDEADAER